ncbi:alpha-amylase 3, chloroplastic-like [Rosa chinensis]|uniref:alpha-amylase 3, chloroplastic-like n=1 Tax=Rosa chinensis TaxID=74649 RepID=UPI001AD91A7F|nr:alpha-amylase 3, chloroplastic-like [Rosa chinensis]
MTQLSLGLGLNHKIAAGVFGESEKCCGGFLGRVRIKTELRCFVVVIIGVCFVFVLYSVICVLIGPVCDEKIGLNTSGTGALGKLSNLFYKAESSNSQNKNSSNESRGTKEETSSLEGFYEELPIAKKIAVVNLVTVSVRKCPETAKNLLYLETDLPDHVVVVHWGVCKDDAKRWEIPAAPHPPETVVFKDKALRTRLQVVPLFRFPLHYQKKEKEEGTAGFLFVFKLSESTWLKCKGNDFYIPLSSANNSPAAAKEDQYEGADVDEGSAEEIDESSFTEYANGIINEIRILVSGISSEKSRKTKSKEAQESILQEIEKLAAEAYSIFRSTVPTFTEEAISESEELALKITSGTGTGFEILCQGFNWESHKSGRWYMELKDKAAELSSLGFTVIWLPPPADSVSPEGYMPTDLYNLNSRQGVALNFSTGCSPVMATKTGRTKMMRLLRDDDAEDQGSQRQGERISNYQALVAVFDMDTRPQIISKKWKQGLSYAPFESSSQKYLTDNGSVFMTKISVTLNNRREGVLFEF